jgi:hypothetical protein
MRAFEHGPQRPNLQQRRPLVRGTPEEVELRACVVVACEAIAAQTTNSQRPVSPVQVASLLWQRGQQARYKATPRPQSQCYAY